MSDERNIEVTRTIQAADAGTIFRVLCDPQGHVAIDSSGMLMSAEGVPVTAVGDTFVVHMDREALNDYPLGRYDVTVTMARPSSPTARSPGRSSACCARRSVTCTATGSNRRTRARSSPRTDDWCADPSRLAGGEHFPVLSEGALRATLGILARTAAAGWPTATPSPSAGTGW